MLTERQQLIVLQHLETFRDAVWLGHFTLEEREFIMSLEPKGGVQLFAKITEAGKNYSQIFESQIETQYGRNIKNEADQV